MSTNRRELKNQLQATIDDLSLEIWSQKRIDDLPESFEKDGYQIEVCFLEMEGKKAHLVVSIDDGSFWRTIFPVSSGLFVKIEAKNGERHQSNAL